MPSGFKIDWVKHNELFKNELSNYTVEDFTSTISLLEVKYGLRDTGAVIRNTDITSKTFWEDDDLYVFEIVDEKKFMLFALKYS